jgi:hypothetical protein
LDAEESDVDDSESLLALEFFFKPWVHNVECLSLFIELPGLGTIATAYFSDQQLKKNIMD